MVNEDINLSISVEITKGLNWCSPYVNLLPCYIKNLTEGKGLKRSQLPFSVAQYCKYSFRNTTNLTKLLNLSCRSLGSTGISVVHDKIVFQSYIWFELCVTICRSFCAVSQRKGEKERKATRREEGNGQVNDSPDTEFLPPPAASTTGYYHHPATLSHTL